jgi:hypothetical protein
MMMIAVHSVLGKFWDEFDVFFVCVLDNDVGQKAIFLKQDYWFIDLNKSTFHPTQQKLYSLTRLAFCHDHKGLLLLLFWSYTGLVCDSNGWVENTIIIRMGWFHKRKLLARMMFGGKW